MANTSQNTFAEGQSITRPPYFDGTNYVYWKMRMQNFLIATDYQLWMIVKNGRTIMNTEDKYSAEDIEQIQLDAKAKNSLYCALAASEFEKISSCDTAKEIWDKLQIAHEGTSQVKETKINLLIHEYESFMMKENENIGEMFGRFQKITNTLKNLGESIEQPKQVKKILRSLPKSWMPKVTAIQEAKDLDKMTVEELMGSLMTHEVLINQKDKTTEEPKGRRTIALKAESEPEEEFEDAEDSEDNEEIAMLSRRLKSIMRRKKGKQFPNNYNKDKKKFVPTCYKCKKPGHMQYECEENDNKVDGKKYQNYFERKGGKPFDRRKRAMLAWEMMEEIMNGEHSEQEKEEKHEAQVSMIDAEEDRRICFMAMEDDEVFLETEQPDLEEMLNELYVDYVKLKNEHGKLKKQLSLANAKCQMLETDKDNLNCEISLKSKCLERLKTENNALRKSLQEVLNKLKERKECSIQRKRKFEKTNKSYVWIPKSSTTHTQPTHTPNIMIKEHEISKFSATNPPGPTLRWVPKLKN